MAEPLVRKWGGNYRPLGDFRGGLRLTVSGWSDALRAEGFSRVICTIGSPASVNNHLIRACRDLGVPVLGVMDHWKRYDRFFDAAGLPSYVPDHVCCIDAASREGFARFMCQPRAISVVGHPQLEGAWLRRTAFTRDPGQGPTRVLVVSQPALRGGALHSAFAENDMNLWAVIVDSLDSFPPGSVELCYRPHPRESAGARLPDSVRFEPGGTWEDALRDHDVFVGIDSIMLVEAALAGKHCVSLALPEIASPLSMEIPYRFSEPGRDIPSFAAAIQRAVERARREDPVETEAIQEMIRGSTDRLAAALEAFLHCREHVEPRRHQAIAG